MLIPFMKCRTLLACLMLTVSPLLEAHTSDENGAVPVYQIDSIPRQLFFRGEAIRLRVDDVKGATFSVKVDPTPTNQPTIDPATGLLIFSPSSSDAGNFIFTITSKHPDGMSCTKQVIVSAFLNLSPEYALVSKARKHPGDEDKRYITVTETEDSAHRAFNNQPERKLVNVVVSGKTVIFDKNNDENGLMTRLNGRQDIESLCIYAETLIFRSPLTLSETDVNIVARRLRFEDVPGQQRAAIFTTPNSLETNPGLGKSGANGLQAGSVTLAIQSFSASAGGSPRFDLTGGNGQDAGLGKAGEQGRDMECLNNRTLADGTCIVHVHQYAGPTTFGPDNTWPGDGGDATPPGAPGAPGSGGDFMSNIIGLDPYVRSVPGQSGKAAQRVEGGRAGHPQHGLSVELVGNHNHIGDGPCPPPAFGIPCSIGNFVPKYARIEGTHDSHAGKGADPPPTPAAAIHSGTVKVAGASDHWLEAMMLRPVLNHAKDAYLGGDLDYTQSVLEDYEPAIDARVKSWDSNAAQRNESNQKLLTQATEDDKALIQARIDRANDDHSSLVQLRLEMEGISLRLRSNFDYFGHPAGWVPQLSFAATLQSYSKEVKNDIPILYLAYYVQASSADRLRHIASLQQSVFTLQSDVKERSDEFNNLQGVIPGLEEQAATVQHKIELYQEEVVNRKNDLMAQADKIVADQNSVPFWKQGLSVLSAVASVCPVGQPVVGSIGMGLGILAKAGDQGAVETAKQLGSLASDFSEQNIKESVDQYHAKLALMDPSKAKDAQSYVKGLVPIAQGLAKEYQTVSASLQARRASSDEVEKEVAQLEAADPNLAALTEQVTSLNQEKQAFEDKVTEALTKSSSISSTIMSDWRGIDAANRALSSATGGLDHEAVQQIAEFGRRTRDRLLLFQYYLSKTYEYRFLQPYPGEFNLDKLLDQLVALTSQPHDQNFHPLSAADYKNLTNVYNESVQEIVNASLDYIQNHPKPLQTSYPYSLTPAQLDTLNREGTVDLNLAQEIPHFMGQENRRLVSITVASANVAPPTDNSQPEAIHVTFDHDGRTTLRSNKQSFLFNQHLARSGQDQPFQWAGFLDGNSWKQDVISPEYIQTLKQLLSLKEGPDYNELFAYPGLESVISLNREGGDTQAIKSLKLTISYDYDKPAESEYPLDVIAPEELKPLTQVDARDNSGRTLGQGSFTRFYPKDAHVTLTAPQQFGTHNFVAWHVPGLGDVNSPTVTVTMTKGIRAQMEYAMPQNTEPRSTGKSN